jgi:DNA-directed RNA polymerase subunit omega
MSMPTVATHFFCAYVSLMRGKGTPEYVGMPRWVVDLSLTCKGRADTFIRFAGWHPRPSGLWKTIRTLTSCSAALLSLSHRPVRPDISRGEAMARITVEDCLEKIGNRFLIVQMAIKRVKQYREGYDPLVESKNKEAVTALREIAAGKVMPDDDLPTAGIMVNEKSAE